MKLVGNPVRDDLSIDRATTDCYFLFFCGAAAAIPRLATAANLAAAAQRATGEESDAITSAVPVVAIA